jgi:hypothetical protein
VRAAADANVRQRQELDLMLRLIRLVFLAALLCLTGAAAARGQKASASVQGPASVQNPAGLRLLIATEHAQPVLRIVLPGRATSDRSIEVLFPEHVTAVKHGKKIAEQLYMFRPGPQGERPEWRKGEQSLEYQRTLPDGVQMLARATLEDDGVRFLYEFTNGSAVAYDMIYAVTDPRLTGLFHDVRLERTYIHHPDGFDLLASEVPGRLTMPPDQWLPARVLAPFTWPVSARRVEGRDDGITYYNKSRAVDVPFIATLAKGESWVVASFAREAGNVWSNPELTCQHVDPQASLPPEQRVAREVKIVIIRATLDDAFQRALRQRESLK